MIFPIFPIRLRLRYKRVLVTLLLVLVSLLASCGRSGESSRATDFELTLFDGSSFKLSDQAGKNAVVLNFWFPSCPPCRTEMPDFEKAWQRLQGKEVRFLGLFVPQGLDSEQDARNFVTGLGLTYDFATDKGAKVAMAYQIAYFPTTYFIDQKGQVFRTEISTLDADSISRIVQDMLQG
jgi:peroxiredoxin